MDGIRPFQIVIAEPYDALAIANLEKVGSVRVLADSAPASIIAAVQDADALLVKAKAHVTARIIEAAPRLKVIARAGPNVDHIDLRAARKRQISIVYAPHVAVTSTAEFNFALIMTLHRRIVYYDRQVHDGKFDALRSPVGREMAHLTLGLLGVDPVAEALARMCKAAFGLPIQYYDPAGRTPTDFCGEAVNLERLLAECDILSIHLPLTDESRHLINAERIAQMKSTSILVNTSRGAVIDTVALAHALRKRTISGAALDVFESEPLATDHPLRYCANCILTPHVAGATLDANAERFNVAEDVVRVLQGQLPKHGYANLDD